MRNSSTPQDPDLIRRFKDKKGSVLILAIILTAAISYVIASLLQYGLTEKRLNEIQILSTEAKNSAESMVEYGFSQLKFRFRRQTSFSVDELRGNPLEIPESAKAFYGDSNIVFDDLELIGGNVEPEATVRYIDPDDPGNVTDPMKGKLVYQREVAVYGKGVAGHPSLGSQSSYARQVLAVRDSPLFSHAVFYNMDLEFHPGPIMNMNGPVHSNANIWLSAVDKLYFHSTVMAHGDIYHGTKKQNVHDQNGDVYIKDIDGKWVNVYKGGGSRSNDSSYVDSRMGKDWRTAATNRWDGNVGSGDHSVPVLNPVGIPNYRPDDPDTAKYDPYNPAYAMIEPQLPDDHDNFKGENIRLEQFSYKAGLIFRVTATKDNSKKNGYAYQVEAYRYNREKQLDPKSEPKMDNKTGLPKEKDLELAKAEAKMGKKIFDVVYYKEDSDGDPTSGFYDKRQKVGLDVIEMDVGVLAEVINEGDKVIPSKDPWNGRYHTNPGNAIDWNGVVYVELPYDDSTSNRDDKVMPALRKVALRLNNASKVPNPDYAKKTGYDPGFTLATNGMLYVKGHFNADGDKNTGSSTDTDDGKIGLATDEAAAALIADSITILSDAFDDKKSKEKFQNRDAEFTEVSAAFLTGIVPTIPGKQSSGGAHNFPRFLEDWKNVEFRYRGSLVAMWESELGHESLDGNTWYDPPKRNWGFSQIFKNGLFPPGTPRTRDFRLTKFEYLTEAEYNEQLETLVGFNPKTSTRGH